MWNENLRNYTEIMRHKETWWWNEEVVKAVREKKEK